MALEEASVQFGLAQIDVDERDTQGQGIAVVVARARRDPELPIDRKRRDAIGLLHGRMKPAEKDDVMRRFRQGALQVLVATTVIEVGIDVPNATVMVIEHAQRFGLSQLHQLRGRIGRGTTQSYCLLVADRVGETASARLRILCETNDGFRIAEEDLRLRGPGELLGTRQHGIPAFKVADLVRDLDLLLQARDDAAEILQGDEDLTRPHHASLRRVLLSRYQDTFDLIDVA